MPGPFFTTHDLLRAGETPDDLTRSVRSGALLRVRRGRYAMPDAPGELIRVVRIGGLATASTAAAHRGVFVPPDDRMHVALPHGAARLRDPDDRSHVLAHRQGLCLHWSVGTRDRLAGGLPLVPVLRMLRDALYCLRPEFAIAMIDSALHERVIRPTDLDALREGLPMQLARLVSCVDGRCESGVESITRFLLQQAGLEVEVQVEIRGIGRVDLLVEGRLIVEVDGRAWHDDPLAFARDRRRGAAAAIGRYRTERFDYRQVCFEWPTVEAAVFSALA